MYRVETCCNFAVLFEIRFSFVVLGEFGNDECTTVSRKRLIYSEGKNIIVIYIIFLFDTYSYSLPITLQCTEIIYATSLQGKY